MSLYPSMIVGLSNKPLAKEVQQQAVRLIGNSAPPVSQALALNAYHELNERLGVQTVGATHSLSLGQSPVQPNSLNASLSSAWSTLLRTSAALTDKPECHTGQALGIFVEPRDLTWFLHQYFRTPPTPWQAFAVLGPRGLWLSQQHPYFAKKLAFLESNRLPAGTRQKEHFLAYHIHNYVFSNTSKEIVDCLLKNAKLADTCSTSILHLLENNQLSKFLAFERIVRLILGGQHKPQELSTIEKLLILVSKTENPSLIDSIAEVLHIEGSKVSTSEQRLNSSGISSGLSKLVIHALSSQDLLQNDHPVIPDLVRSMKAAEYETVVDLIPKLLSQGWKAKTAQRLLETGPHPVSSALSKSWIHQAFRSPSPFKETRAGKLIWKLNPKVANDIDAHQYEIYNQHNPLLLKQYLHARATLIRSKSTQ